MASGKRQAATTQARLASAIKAARNIMRKDAGLTGETDRIPQLSWLLFLRAFDAQEAQREVTERDFHPTIAAPYRWRDWAGREGPTGDELIAFIEARLLPYLRGLSGSRDHDAKDVLAAVFKETHNRMLSGYLLRDVIDCVNEVNFESADDIHTMAFLYESMLRELRDGAKDTGEFYTPRPLIRFIVQQVHPRLGEIVLDPACGTGGFLVEALAHLRPLATSVDEWTALQGHLRGVEKKPMPYLLGMMNLLLHGIGRPALSRSNALARPVSEIRAADQVDVIVTNPPFGGEEERAIQENFPAGLQTSETALLFLQVIERLLKVQGRCGMIVPNGVLSAGGAAAKIKERLLKQCNLHTVVRLPAGVFDPYTPIPSNLLFFEKSGRTQETWFYEVAPPVGKKKFSQSTPLRFDDLQGCQEWWGGAEREGRTEDSSAWRVPFALVEAADFNLDFKNPSLPVKPEDQSLGVLAETLRAADVEFLGLLTELEGTTSRLTRARTRQVPLSQLMEQVRRPVRVDATKAYSMIGIRSAGAGIFLKEVLGLETKATSFNQVRAGDFIYSRLFAWQGSFALVESEFDSAYASGEFPTFVIDEASLWPGYLLAWLQRSETLREVLARSTGSTPQSRNRLREDRLLGMEIDLPDLEIQKTVAAIHDRARLAARFRESTNDLSSAIVRSSVAEAFSKLMGSVDTPSP